MHHCRSSTAVALFVLRRQKGKGEDNDTIRQWALVINKKLHHQVKTASKTNTSACSLTNYGYIYKKKCISLSHRLKSIAMQEQKEEEAARMLAALIARQEV